MLEYGGLLYHSVNPVVPVLTRNQCLERRRIIYPETCSDHVTGLEEEPDSSFTKCYNLNVANFMTEQCYGLLNRADAIHKPPSDYHGISWYRRISYMYMYVVHCIIQPYGVAYENDMI